MNMIIWYNMGGFQLVMGVSLYCWFIFEHPIVRNGWWPVPPFMEPSIFVFLCYHHFVCPVPLLPDSVYVCLSSHVHPDLEVAAGKDDNGTLTMISIDVPEKFLPCFSGVFPASHVWWRVISCNLPIFVGRVSKIKHVTCWLKVGEVGEINNSLVHNVGNEGMIFFTSNYEPSSHSFLPC